MSNYKKLISGFKTGASACAYQLNVPARLLQGSDAIVTYAGNCLFSRPDAGGDALHQAKRGLKNHLKELKSSFSDEASPFHFIGCVMGSALSLLLIIALILPIKFAEFCKDDASSQSLISSNSN